MTEETGPADVYAADGYFAVIPEWILDSGVSSRAVHVYALLRRYADQRTAMATPSRKTLAGRLGLSDEKSVDRALQELEAAGAIRIAARYSNGDRARVQVGPTPEFSQRAANGYLLLARRHPESHYPGASAATGITPTNNGGGGGENAPTPRLALLPDQDIREEGGGAGTPTPLRQDGEGWGHSDPPGGVKNGEEPKKELTTKNTRSAKPSIRATDLTESFAIFWQGYPRRVGKIAAQKAFAKAAKQAGGPEAVLAGLAAATFSADPQYVPHPATWLNQGRWEDEPDRAAAPAKETRPWESTEPDTARPVLAREARPWES